MWLRLGCNEARVQVGFIGSGDLKTRKRHLPWQVLIKVLFVGSVQIIDLVVQSFTRSILSSSIQRKND